MSEKALTGKDILKRVLPVGIALVLIVLIAVIATSAKSCNNKRPKINNPDAVYLQLGDLKVTNERLYTFMKKNYGVAELLRMVDEKLYTKELQEIDDEKLTKYIYKNLFSVEDLKDYTGDLKKEWDKLIDSFLMSGLITKAEATDNDKVWEVAKSYYKLQYAREQWAKAEFLKRYKEDREAAKKEGLFDKDDIEDYYEEHYSGTVVGFFIPFTSQEAAYAMMKRYGINTNSSVLSKNGWITSSYDYNSTVEPEKSQWFTYDQVMEAFFGMYNEVLGYYNNGNDIVTADAYTKVYDELKTAYKVGDNLGDLISNYTTPKGNLILPLTAPIVGKDSATITWKVEDSAYLKLGEDGQTLTMVRPAATSTKATVKVEATVKVGASEVKETYTFTIEKENDQALEETKTLVVENTDLIETIQFKEDFLNSPGNKFSKFTWNTEELTAINSTLATQLKYDSTKLLVTEDPDKFYNSYTVSPVQAGNYYYLIVKMSGQAAPTLEDVTDEIIEKMSDELLTENNITKMIYQGRQDNKLKIYDSFIEAVYEYNYKYFYETTLKVTDYPKYKLSKKNKTAIVASFEVDGKTIEITAQELFDQLEQKYGVATTLDLINQYNVVGNSALNKIYNPYTGEKYDEKTFKELLKTEISSLRKNFEMNYFTYSYLSYYGFIPNFPSSYGWSNFSKDYFGSYTDEELLASSAFGGSIYNDALESLTKSLYDTEGYWKEMNKLYDDWYGVDVMNIVISIDYNYDSKIDDNVVGQKDADKETTQTKVTEWTDAQKALAKELGALMMEKATETGEKTLSDQLTALVKQYNEADYNIPLGNGSGKTIYEYNFWAKYKQAGLFVKFEASQAYDSSSSLVEEFLDAIQVIWKQVKEMGLLGQTLDAPILCDEAFETTYGYHMIAVTKANEPTRLPTQEEIDLYKLFNLVEKYKDTTISYQKEKYDAAKKELDEMIKKLGFEEDYTLSDEAKASLEKWYDPAIKNIEQGQPLTDYLNKTVREQIANDFIKYTNATGLERLDIVLTVNEKTDDEDAE